ncbi:MAG TPA: hypothetical protein VFB22_18060 [Candidatus Baltobacteraceae bacterium]|nr:hypothetical protein [Candidatus Baltobacteraceae bacterium]
MKSLQHLLELRKERCDNERNCDDAHDDRDDSIVERIDILNGGLGPAGHHIEKKLRVSRHGTIASRNVFSSKSGPPIDATPARLKAVLPRKTSWPRPSKTP